MPKFRLLRGRHIENGPDGKERSYSTGDTFESNSDLDKQFNAIGMDPKFERLTESTPTNSRVWNPALESLDNFTERMRKENPVAAIPQGQTAGQAAQAGFDTIHTDSGRQPPKRDGLENLNVKELQAMAAEEEIDLKGATKKEEILKIIRSSPVSQSL